MDDMLQAPVETDHRPRADLNDAPDMVDQPAATSNYAKRATWISANREAVLELFEQGLSVPDVYEELGGQEDWIREVGYDAGVKPPRAKQKRTAWIEENTTDVVQAIERGLETVGQLAHRFTVPEEWIRTIAKAAGVKPPRQGSDRTRDRDAAMAAARRAGATLEEIGTQFGLTRERVRQILDRLGDASAEESRHVRRVRETAEWDAVHGPAIRTAAQQEFSIQGVAERIGQPTHRVSDYMRANSIVCTGPRPAVTSVFSDAEIFRSLNRAAEWFGAGVSLSTERYDAWRHARNPEAPSSVLIAMRIGWSNAKVAAGLDGGRERKGTWTYQWVPQLAVEAVRRFMAETGETSHDAYTRWRENERFTAPSPSRARRLLGTWPNALRMAQEWQRLLDDGVQTVDDIQTFEDAQTPSVARLRRNSAMSAVSAYRSETEEPHTLAGFTERMGKAAAELVASVFTDWDAALAETNPSEPERRRWTDDELAATADEFAATGQQGVTAYWAWSEANGRPSYSTMTRRGFL